MTSGTKQVFRPDDGSLSIRVGWLARLTRTSGWLVRLRKQQLKGLILAQNERWRRGLGMQVVRET
jgi:hypothetical protein